MNILKEITSSQARSTLLEFFAYNEDRELQFGQLQKELLLNPRQLTVQLAKLKEINFVHERKSGNKKFYRANKNVFYFKALKDFVISLRSNDEEWFRWERACTIHHIYTAGEAAMRPMKEYFGVCWSTCLLIFTGENILWRTNTVDMSERGGKIVKWYQKNEKKYLMDVENATKKLSEIFAEVTRANLEKMSNDDLLKLYQKMHDTYLHWYGLLWTTELVAVYMQNQLKDPLKNFKAADVSILTAMTQKSFSQEIEEAYQHLINLAQKKKENFQDKTLRKAVQSFQKNYFWMYNNYFDTRVLEEEEIILEVKKRLKSKRKFTSSLVTNKQKVTLIKQLKIDQETQNLLNISDQFTYFQDLRKKWIMIYAHYLEVLLAEVGRRAKMTIHEMRYTFPHEIQFLLQGKKIDVAPRQKNCLVVFKEGAKRGDFYLGQKAKVAERKYISQADTQGDQQILKGKVACSGKAIGPVKVLMNPSESYKVNHGDILVTSMTSPDFMAAMRKCVGIITNEGGLTCHAAVVSRELNIPCVIATKNATKVLKDCDRVEIDADTGTIYLVS